MGHGQWVTDRTLSTMIKVIAVTLHTERVGWFKQDRNMNEDSVMLNIS